MSGAVTTVVQAKIFTDHTGAAAHVPVLLTENGVVGPLLDYMLQLAGRSRAWQRNLLRAVRLLLDYGVANRGSFASERELFVSFVERLYGGTVGEDGCDASGLYWRPMRWAQANALLHVLAEFTAHLAQERGDAPPLARLRPASSHEDLLAWAGWAQRKHHSFLGHTQTATETRYGREPRCAARQMPRVIGEEVKAFPEGRFMELLLHGFVQRGQRDADNLAARLNLRDCLITLMMHGGGCRLSECFHLYVQDVALDPHDATLPVVRIHHPSEGAAPDDWTNEKGGSVRGQRAAYLARLGLRPRSDLRDTRHAGWKNPALDGRHYMELKWFPADYGRLFLKLWQLYLRQIAGVPRAHPFAWLTLDRREPAMMYRMTHYHRAHGRAVRRIGLVAAKSLGTTPHGHRHAYGRRLWAAQVDPLVRMRALHHRALDSQQVYTEPPLGEIVRALAQAETRMAAGEKSPPVPAPLLAAGFEEVDPGGLLSGPRPKLPTPV
ncbi:MAG: gamma-mobile-trio recombinase GmtY [Opitutaceae bacterium]|nr:gamma-mobile-trio recombinase GmtY [Opitutaceae bacterium]